MDDRDGTPGLKTSVAFEGGEREGARSQREISILIWDHDLSPRDDSCVCVALRARVSPHEVCPRGSLDAYCRSSAWIG